MIKRLTEHGVRCTIAAPVWHELVYGRNGKERARLEGEQRPFVDGQIAAIAHTHELTLVTTKTKDFEAFEDVLLADWTR